MQPEEEFFYYLLDKTKTVFENSPVKIKQENLTPPQKWNYAVCETTIQKRKAIIAGLNWGGKNHEPQKEYPKANKEKRDWNFLNNSNSYLRKFLGIENIEEVNYTNVSFFRSPEIEYLSFTDWEMAIPLFKEYCDFIEPTQIIILGSSVIPILKKLKVIELEPRIEINYGEKRVFGFKGKLFSEYNIYCVPHPQAKISTEARNNIWNNLFKK